MKVVTWNVNVMNKKVMETLNSVLQDKPDVVCLQEFPERFLPQLDKFSDYKYRDTYDAKGKADDGMLIVTLVKKKIEIKSSEKFTYIKRDFTSLLDFGYKYITGRTEFDDALVVTLNTGLKVVNARLSTATSPRNRIRMLSNIFNKYTVNRIICGDMNTSNNFWFNLFSGFIRGYSVRDLFFDEGKAVNKLIEENGLTNPFKGTKTLSYWWLPTMQLDYIMISRRLLVPEKVCETTGGSDHCVLKLEYRHLIIA